MKRSLVVASLLALSACGGKSGTLALSVVVSPADDPFVGATQVRVTVGGGGAVKTFAVTNGTFNIKLDQKPSMNSQPITVEALDAANNVVGFGQTPPIALVAADQTYSVWVGRPGRFAPAHAKLPSARTEMAGAQLPALGLMMAGGRDATGAVLKDSCVYDVRIHDVIVTASMNFARAGGSGAALSGLRSAVFGGSTVPGLGAPGMPLATLELFDPTDGSGLWANLQADTVDARSFADSTQLGSGATLISGGADANGLPLASAAQVTGDASPRLAALGAMQAARLGHAVAAVSFPDGPGAILFGGLAVGSTAPVAERLLGSAFSPYVLPGVTNRAGATATTLPNGNVLIVGGHDATGALASGFVIVPSVPPAITQALAALSTPRDGHTATLVGNDVLVCGGANAAGVPQASCDLVDGTALTPKLTVQLSNARRGHTAALLLSGNVVIAGGLGPDGRTPIDSIEVYTPAR